MGDLSSRHVFSLDVPTFTLCILNVQNGSHANFKRKTENPTEKKK